MLRNEIDTGTDSGIRSVKFPSSPASLSNSIIKIIASLTIGAFLAWIVNVDWVLETIAGIILCGCVVLGIFTGYWIYKSLSDSNPHWSRLTIAIILGISITFTVLELTHSHKLIRDYELFSSDNEE